MTAGDVELYRQLQNAGDLLLFYAHLQPSEFDSLEVDRSLSMVDRYLETARPSDRR